MTRHYAIRIKHRRMYLDMATPQVWGHNPTGSIGVMAAKSILRRRPAPTIMYLYGYGTYILIWMNLLCPKKKILPNEA